MASQKSNDSHQARAPKRERGKARVEALLSAATQVFAAKGFDAATMTEIAGAAGAPIGSLYQFFPTKAALARTLLERYGTHMSAHLSAIEQAVPTLSLDVIVARLLGLLTSLAEERRCAMALLDAKSVPPEQRQTLRKGLREGTARVLVAYAPELSASEAEVAAVVVVNSMRAMVHLGEERCAEQARAQWQAMLVAHLRGLPG
ncbi:TetR/AcrR family transcriptional regulator [Larsenimonas salina]|uniref:TetR/AcrR family transcriptional regulator n=1 Tax=Larsenimonas salina TaxID=1295565 RepID=UPI00207344D3|nr:TetR/AcrR family transcriptional regulator [Larsenimonas salina]MCM5705181.1 TetR/AcrR family transcriptional regulator [Larsenimonas salina]